MSAPLSKSLGSFLCHFLKPHKKVAAIYTLLAIITGLWAPINSILIKIMIDTLNAQSNNMDVSVIFWPAILFIANFEVQNMAWRGLSYFNYIYEPMIKNNMIRQCFSYIHKHTHQFFQDNLSGRISNQINILADNAEKIIHDLYRHLVRSLVLLVTAFISMYYVHPVFFYALLAWLLVFMAFSLTMSRRIIQLSQKHATSESVLAGEMVDSISNAGNVRIFSKRHFELTHLDRALHQTKDAFRKNALYSIKLNFLQGLSLTTMFAVMLYTLIQLYAKHQVTIGDFALIIGLSMDVGYMTWWAMDRVEELNKSIGKCKESLSQLFVPLDITDKIGASKLQVTKAQIEFHDVKFHYKGSDALFKNESVTIYPMQKVGLVGYSGSGKTTFVNLILRLYDINSGSICIDDQSIQDVTQSSLRDAIAMIPQDPSLFQRNLMDNIRYGRLDASDEEVIEASKQAHCHDFIMALADGYQTLAGERGIKLSGGQRQRIAIARALLKKSPILILDEATSQLDSITEEYIQESVNVLMKDKTTLIIAHRLATLLHMDRIIVFDKGSIVEDGSHSDLLAANGLYKSLWDAQIGGFLPDNDDD